MTVTSIPAIEVEDLRRSYRRARRMRDVVLHPSRVDWTEALRGVSFQVAEGEVLGVLGPNGAGKTSLVKILATLVLPTGGAARVFGHDVASEAPEVLSRVGLVLSDERSFYWRLTVRENLLFFATLNGIERGRRASRVQQLLEIVDVGDWADRAFRDLSAGIRQRVALARAMLSDPPVLLMDEPTNSLDPSAARRFRDWIRDELVGRRGKTLLLVTHDAGEANDLCDRVGVLKRGRLEFLGTPAELVSGRGGPAGYHLRVAGWTDSLAEALSREGVGAGLPAAGVDELVSLELREEQLTGVLGLLGRHEVRVLSCERRVTRFDELVADLLGTNEGVE